MNESEKRLQGIRNWLDPEDGYSLIDAQFPLRDIEFLLSEIDRLKEQVKELDKRARGKR